MTFPSVVWSLHKMKDFGSCKDIKTLSKGWMLLCKFPRFDAIVYCGCCGASTIITFTFSKEPKRFVLFTLCFVFLCYHQSSCHLLYVLCHHNSLCVSAPYFMVIWVIVLGFFHHAKEVFFLCKNVWISLFDDRQQR